MPNKLDSERSARPSDESVLNYTCRFRSYVLIGRFIDFSENKQIADTGSRFVFKGCNTTVTAKLPGFYNSFEIMCMDQCC